MTDEEAIAILRSRSGTMYDPLVVEAFIRLVPSLRRNDRLVDAEAVGSPRDPQRSSPDGSYHRLDNMGVSLIDIVKRSPPEIRTAVTNIESTAEGCLFMLDYSTAALTAVHGTPPIQRFTTTLRLRLDDSLSGWVAANHYPIVNSSADLDLGAEAAKLGLQLCTAMPVFAFGNLAGVLSLYSRKSIGFSEEQVRQIGVLAQRLGLSIVESEVNVPAAHAAGR
jgi:hypothetical protein